ncbi:MAG: FAD binding domain-containing protein, partial [Steroidobacteraceae bacterium]
PMLNLRLSRPSTVIDVSRLPELQGVHVEGDELRIGAAVTHAQIEDAAFDVLRGSFLASVARGIAYRAVRNRGTIGGSLAHADPAADWVVVCAALAARLDLVSASGRRRVAMDEFMLGAYTTALREGELIEAVRLPQPSPQARWAYRKLCRKTGEFSEATCAAYFDAARGFARIVLGALDGPPRILEELTRTVAAGGGAAVTDQAIASAVASETPDRDEVDRQRYRAVVRRCLAQLFDFPDKAVA